MGWLLAQIYDRQMQQVERACLRAWRRSLLQQAAGEVLEIGAGTGANLDLYPGEVERLTLNEPDPHMRGKLHGKASGATPPYRLVAGDAERLDCADESFDTVVSTLVLCSVGDLARATRELVRVLRPGGKLIFIEHVGAEEGSSRRRWQGRVEPVWRRIAGNCHLTRDSAAALERAGLSFETLERESMRKAMPIVRPTVRGVAIKRR